MLIKPNRIESAIDLYQLKIELKCVKSTWESFGLAFEHLNYQTLSNHTPIPCLSDFRGVPRPKVNPLETAQ